jgi:hypothetical protein
MSSYKVTLDGQIAVELGPKGRLLEASVRRDIDRLLDGNLKTIEDLCFHLVTFEGTHYYCCPGPREFRRHIIVVACEWEATDIVDRRGKTLRMPRPRRNA